MPTQPTMQDEVFRYAEWLWKRSYVLPSGPNVRVVIGTDPLPFPWEREKKKFPDARTAGMYLNFLSGNTSAMFSLDKLFRSLNPGKLQALAKDELIAAVSAALAGGRAWIIELLKDRDSSPGLTDPAVFSALNLSLGTKIDFGTIATYEGGQFLRGYVPFHLNGTVVGRSGMTVATGFDIGQWGQDEITGRGKKKGMNFPQELLDQILPFTDPHNFKMLTRAQVVAKVGEIGPVPNLQGHKNWADLCDSVVFRIKTKNARDGWNNYIEIGVPGFIALPGGWQTVWVSRSFQGQTGSFENLALAGDWEKAIKALRNEPGYKSRTNPEADLLAAEMPPPVVKPPVKGKL